MTNSDCQRLADQLLETLDTEPKADKWLSYLHKRLLHAYGPELVTRVEHQSPSPKRKKAEVLMDEERFEE